MAEVSSESSSVQVLERAGRVLDCFTATNPRLRASDVVTATGLPASTVARLLRALTEQNLLHRQGVHYSIGLRVTAWAAAANAGSDLIATALPLVTTLRDRCRETCGIYLRQGATRVAVLQVESTQSVVYRGYVGQLVPLAAGAAGKVFMAYDPGALRAVLEQGLVRYTDYTVTDPDLLRDQLEQVRRDGWAFAEQERELGLSSIAAPVFGATGEIVAAVAVGAPASRLTRTERKAMVGPLIDCAAAISRGLLYQPGESAGENSA